MRRFCCCLLNRLGSLWCKTAVPFGRRGDNDHTIQYNVRYRILPRGRRWCDAATDRGRFHKWDTHTPIRTSAGTWGTLPVWGDNCLMLFYRHRHHSSSSSSWERFISKCTKLKHDRQSIKSSFKRQWPGGSCVREGRGLGKSTESARPSRTLETNTPNKSAEWVD